MEGFEINVSDLLKELTQKVIAQGLLGEMSQEDSLLGAFILCHANYHIHHPDLPNRPNFEESVIEEIQ